MSHNRVHRGRRPLVAAAVATALMLVGCSGAGGSEEPSPKAKTPSRIVSLSPTATETLFAIGAGDQVIAVDSLSDTPKEAPRTDLSAFNPNAEAVLAKDPDLVIIAQDVNGIADSLESANVEVILAPTVASIDEAYQQVGMLGEATGHTDEAAEVTSTMHDRITKAIARVPESVRNAEVSYFHELDSTLYTAGNGTFIGEIYGLFGLTSIAEDGADYPQLSNEQVVSENPEVIFLADAGSDGGVSPDDVKSRPGWAETDAVKNENIFPVDANLASRWGPSLPEFIESLSDILTEQAQLPELVPAA